MAAINKYNQLRSTPSDINEHLPVLKRYAEECDVVVEMGVRWVVSTFAFICAKPKKLISLDIHHPNHWGGGDVFEEAIRYCKEDSIDFSFVQSSSLDYDMPECDLLFIDTWHAYRQLRAELNLHHKKVRKYIILHDTELFCNQDETAYGPAGEGDEVGICNAMNRFINENPDWVIHEKFKNNNGLTVLKRVK